MIFSINFLNIFCINLQSNIIFSPTLGTSADIPDVPCPTPLGGGRRGGKGEIAGVCYEEHGETRKTEFSSNYDLSSRLDEPLGCADESKSSDARAVLLKGKIKRSTARNLRRRWVDESIKRHHGR